MSDRAIIQWYHRLELAFLTVSLIVIFTISDSRKWAYIYFAACLIILGVSIFRYSVFLRLNRNLHAISDTFNGKFEPGNYLWLIPPHIRFTYQGIDCRVRSIIDHRFRLVMQYSCQFAKEWEFRLDKRRINGVVKYMISGANKELYRRILKNPEARLHLKRLLRDFDHLYYGKDGMIRAESIFDSYLTDQQMILGHLNRMLFLGRFLKLDEE